ncbi:MAG: DUF5591 domain-containing protein [Promethearchaeota archaeon]
MTFFFEVLKTEIGLARTGRILVSKQNKRYLYTPNVIIPLNSILMNQIDFKTEFEDHVLFKISKEGILKSDILERTFNSASFLYISNSTLEKFQEIIVRNKIIFIEKGIFAIIPFNIPTTAINKNFAVREIENYLKKAEIILKNNADINLGLTVKIFDFLELSDMYLEVIRNNKNIKILNLADIFDNISNFRKIIDFVLNLKQKLDNNIILIASGRIIPNFYPILVYLGIDLVDSSFLLYLSSENFYNSLEYLLPIYKIKYLPCSCRACRGELKNLQEEKYSSEKISLLSLHNLISAKTYMNKIIQYLNYEDFRAFVEKSSLDDTNLISMLRILDKKYFDLIKYETPITQKNKKVNCLGSLSYHRPDFQVFRERTIMAFEPEQQTRLIILFPCSAGKPYSESKSHKKFLSILRKYPEFPDFQEIILTSPLGAIPRQLENVYPANSYDISVTGDWNEEEIKISADMLIKLLEKYDPDIPIICHLEGEYLEILNRVKKELKHKFYFTEISQSLTTKESLQSLKSLVDSKIKDFSPDESISKKLYLSKTWDRKFNKILDYQYGKGSGIKILSNGIKIRKGKPHTHIEILASKTNNSLGVFNYSTGQIDLSIKGASLLAPSSETAKIIVFNGKKMSGNTLFRPGVLEFSQNLVPYDNVIILDEQKENIVGMGHIIIGSNVLRNTKTGRVAIIYESAK